MINELTHSFHFIIQQTQHQKNILAIILLIPWIFFFVSRFISQAILLLGIIPRRLWSLPGILFAPLLHADFNHLFFNSIPLVVLSDFILLEGLHAYLIITSMITLLSGLAIWCFAPRGLYIGASALVTGYWGFLISSAYQHTTMTTLILGLFSLYYFAGIFFGIFPGEKGVSWLGHLFGLLSGLTTSYLLSHAIH